MANYSPELSKILVVDDNEFNRTMIQELFSSRGYKSVYAANNGKEAYQKTLKIKPDLVILDINMPVWDGFRYCYEVRKIPEFMHLAILVQSAYDQPDNIVKAFEAGANDFVSSPFVTNEVLARVNVLLHNRFLIKKLSEYHQQMEANMELARRMQAMIMPSDKQIEEIQQKHNISLETYFHPSQKIGGDFWGVHSHSAQKFYLFIIDFSGHGFASAINTFRIHLMLPELLSNEDSPAKILTNLNKQLYALLPRGQFATMFLALINTKSSTLTYSSAASTTPIFYSCNTDTFTCISQESFPLGVTSDARYVDETEIFAKGDGILLYSDALLETADEKGKFLSDSEVLRAASNGGEIFTPVERLISIHSRDYTLLKDDLTLVGCTRL